MAEVKDCEDSALPWKRNPDTRCPDSITDPKKKRKLENPEEDIDNNGVAEEDDPEKQQHEVDTNIKNDVVDKGMEGDEAVAVEEEDSTHLNGKAVIDRKGKGIVIEESEDEGDDDDDDYHDSSDYENLSDGDSDLYDDPPAEVDLDNVLPSRTLRRIVQPGAYVANDVGKQ
ncbi:hypothetical protein Ancab_026419 [Ancistrocladus abbreviatus]